MSLRLPAALVAGVALLAPSSFAAQARPSPSPAPTVPLVVGLVTVSAVHQPEKGDYETILEVDAVSAQSFGFTVSGNVEDRRMTIKRHGQHRGPRARARVEPALQRGRS